MLLTGTPSMLAATWLDWVSWMTPAGPCLKLDRVKLGPQRNYHEGRAAIRHYANQPARPL